MKYGFAIAILAALAAAVVVSSHAWREESEAVHRLRLRRTGAAGPWDVELAEGAVGSFSPGARARTRGEDLIVFESSAPYYADELEIFDRDTHLRARAASTPLIEAADIVRVTDSNESWHPTCAVRLRAPLHVALPPTLLLVRPGEGALAVDARAVDAHTIELSTTYESLQSVVHMIAVCSALRGGAIATRWEIVPPPDGDRG